MVVSAENEGVQRSAKAPPPSIHDYTCPICLELMLRPVKLSCGHCFCRGCWVRVLQSRSVRVTAHLTGSVACPFRCEVQPVVPEVDQVHACGAPSPHTTAHPSPPPKPYIYSTPRRAHPLPHHNPYTSPLQVLAKELESLFDLESMDRASAYTLPDENIRVAEVSHFSDPNLNPDPISLSLTLTLTQTLTPIL